MPEFGIRQQGRSTRRYSRYPSQRSIQAQFQNNLWNLKQ
jgi:hypothetical protein